MTTSAAVPAEWPELQIGVVGTAVGFDPLEKDTGGNYVHLTFAEGLAKRAPGLFKSYSFPVPGNDKGQEWVDLCGEIRRKTGYRIRPIVLVDEKTNPADAAVEDAATQNLIDKWTLCDKAEADDSMGPSAETWQPVSERWAKSDPKPLNTVTASKRLLQSAKVHANAWTALPTGKKKKHRIEYLFDGEQATVNTLARAALVASKANELCGGTDFSVTHDGAHRYAFRAYSAEELAAMLEEDRKLHEKGLIGLLHYSCPRKRWHPMNGPYPQEQHFKGQWLAGYRGFVDTEIFGRRIPFLHQLLPEFTGGNPRFSDDDPWTPNIDAARALKTWYLQLSMAA